MKAKIFALFSYLLVSIITISCSDDPLGIDGRTYGGCWKYAASDCTPSSWKSGDSSANKIPGTVYIKELNAVDGRYITVRLVYSIPE